MTIALADSNSSAIPIVAVTAASYEAWLATRGDAERAWLATTGFKPEPGKTALVPGVGGGLARVVQGVDEAAPIWALADLPGKLPEGLYRVEGLDDPAQAALGWALGAYAFTRYKAASREPARLAWPEGVDEKEITALAEGIAVARDLINISAEDMGPAELAAAAHDLATRHDAAFEVIVGDELKRHNYPLIHAVGRGSARAPRLVDLRWGDPAAPKLTLVGKGVCFDSGGLDIKSSSGMKLMKKDMGGAATLLGLAHAIMATGLNVRLRLLVPAVENSISANAFRPMDVFPSRKGMTVEIGNTDAEGRLVLGDALAEAVTEAPSLLIDMATLTGAARVALGPELPALFGTDDAACNALLAAGTAVNDPLWRLPLWKPYRKMLDSRIADINNASDSGFAGSITAALYLQEFVEPDVPWLHIDTYAWNPSSRPGRPEGGEALALRALYTMLKERFRR